MKEDVRLARVIVENCLEAGADDWEKEHLGIPDVMTEVVWTFNPSAGLVINLCFKGESSFHDGPGKLGKLRLDNGDAAEELQVAAAGTRCVAVVYSWADILVGTQG